MTKLGPAGQTKGKEANLQEVEENTGDLRRVQRCMVVQRWDEEDQGETGSEPGKEHNKKGFLQVQKRKVKESVFPPTHSAGKLITTGEKLRYPVFNDPLQSLTSQVNEQQDGGWKSKIPSTVNKDLLRTLNIHKSVEMHPEGEDKMRVLKELSHVVTKAFSMIFEKSWHSDEVPGDWKRGTHL